MGGGSSRNQTPVNTQDGVGRIMLKANLTLICVENMNQNNVFNIQFNSEVCVSRYELSFLIPFSYTMYTKNHTVIGDSDEQHVVNIVHISAFLSHFQGGIQQQK